jgi:CRP-like cAMP-binding protein
MSLFTGAPRSATVVAKGPATVLEIGKPLMGKLLGEDDALAAAFAHLIMARQTANQRAAEDSRRPDIEVAAEEQSMLKRIASFFGLHRPSSKPDG